MLLTFFKINSKILESCSVNRNLTSHIESFQKFISSKTRIRKLSSEQLFVGKHWKKFSNALKPLRNASLRHIIILRRLFYLRSRVVLNSLRLEHTLINIDFQSLAHNFISLVSAKERSEKHFAMNSGDRDRVIKNDSINFFLYLFDILLGNLQKSISEENITRIETWVETNSLVCNVHSPTQKNFVTQSTGKTLIKPLIR